MRRAVRLVHLWLAFVVGSLVVLVCVTGSVLVYEEELDRLLDPSFFDRETKGPSGEPGSRIALGRIVGAARAHRSDARLVFLDFCHLPRGPAIANMQSPGAGRSQLAVDPKTGDVIGERPKWRFLGIVRGLHIDLLAGDAGYTVVGIAGVVLLAMMLSGLYLWWPRNRRWRVVLTLKRRASPIRRHFDLHRVFGAYTFVPMLVAVLTGVILVFPGYTVDLVLTEPYPEPPPLRVVDPTRELDPDRLIPIARGEIPDGKVLLIHFPREDRPFYSVSFRSFENGHPRGRSYVHVYPDTGEVRWAKATRGASLSYQLRMEWLVPTHSGDVAGHWGKVPILASGLAPVGLLITGLVIWTRRRAAARQQIRAGVLSDGRSAGGRGAPGTP